MQEEEIDQKRSEALDLAFSNMAEEWEKSEQFENEMQARRAAQRHKAIEAAQKGESAGLMGEKKATEEDEEEGEGERKREEQEEQVYTSRKAENAADILDEYIGLHELLRMAKKKDR